MIRLTIRKIIGQQAYTFSFEGEDLFDVVMESQQLGFRDVLCCGLCKSKALYLRAYVTEKDKYEYVKVCCGNPACRAQATFGKAKKDGAFFLRKDEKTHQVIWEAFKPAEGDASAEKKPNGEKEDYPF